MLKMDKRDYELMITDDIEFLKTVKGPGCEEVHIKMVLEDSIKQLYPEKPAGNRGPNPGGGYQPDPAGGTGTPPINP